MLPFIKLHSTTILGKFIRTSLAVRGPIQKYHQNGELLTLGKIYDKEVAQKDWFHSVLVRCILTVTTVSVLVNGPLDIISLRLFFNLTLTLQMIPECFASRKSPGCLGFPAGHILYYYTVSQIGTRFGPVFFRHFTVLQRHVKGTDRSWVPGECQVEKQVGWMWVAAVEWPSLSSECY